MTCEFLCKLFIFLSFSAVIQIAVSQNSRGKKQSPTIFADCDEALRTTNTASGIFNIRFSEPSTDSIAVFCLQDNPKEAAWIVIQRRVNNSNVLFNRTWDEYKRGFGDKSKSFFIGLDNLHLLANAANPQELWVRLKADVVDVDNPTGNAYYDRFEIADESEYYAIKSLGQYRGNAGNSLKYHLGMKFTTHDADHDEWAEGNCAELYQGGWWYNLCHQSMLNGAYDSKNDDGIHWHHFRGEFATMKYAHMAIRPVKK